MDTSLDHISNYLASFLLDENNYHGLQNGEDAPDEQRAILADFTDYLDTYTSTASLFFYIPNQDILIFQSANYDSYPERMEMRNTSARPVFLVRFRSRNRRSAAGPSCV